MKRRGPIIGFIGAALSMGAFLATLSSVQTLESDIDALSLSNLFDDIFSQVHEVELYPGESNVFSYTGSDSEIPLLWGIQINDYQQGDKLSVTISNIYGDLYTFEQNEPVFFDTFMIPDSNSIDFSIQNTGNRPMNVIMMLIENPDDPEKLPDLTSPAFSTILSLAISGAVFLIGIIVIIAGAIIGVIDWRKTKNQSRI